MSKKKNSRVDVHIHTTTSGVEIVTPKGNELKAEPVVPKPAHDQVPSGDWVRSTEVNRYHYPFGKVFWTVTMAMLFTWVVVTYAPAVYDWATNEVETETEIVE